jgi:MoxR-like ATPase
MADFISELLGFARKSLPTPFDTLTGRTVAGGSKYSPDPVATRQSTLAGGFTTALTHIISTDIDETNKVAIGSCGVDVYVCEYHSSIDDIFDIVVYDADSGDLSGSVYNSATASGDKYILEKDKKNGNAIHGALFPVYYDDEEFAENYDLLKNEAKAGYPDRNYAAQLMGILNDNVYRRMKDSTIASHIKFSIASGKSFALNMIRNAAFTSGTYDPSVVKIGKFEMLSGNTTTSTASAVSKSRYTKEDLIGKFPINPTRVFTDEEKRMMESSRLDDYYIVSETDLKICNIIQQTTNTNIPFRNFTFRGDAGTGKSAKAKAVSNGICLPQVIYTCSSNTEIFDFIGQVMPDTNINKYNDKIIKRLEELGGITFGNIAKVLGLPSLSDIDFDPAMFFEDMTGKVVTDENDCYIIDGENIGDITAMKKLAVDTWQSIMEENFNKIIDTMKNGKDETKFVYTETDFIKAIKYGWVVEIQEPNVILSEGVLVGLNGLLAEGRITLPTGETIERHPDCVVIFTTNVTYNGCRAMNQSVIDRSNKVYDIEAPSVEVMAERAISMSGNENEEDVLEMAQIIKDIASEMNSSGIDDGVCGMRSLANWALASRFEDPYEAFNECVLSKTSMDEESRLTLRKRIDESKFKPVVKKRRI